jgi:hypothetical protein
MSFRSMNTVSQTCGDSLSDCEASSAAISLTYRQFNERVDQWANVMPIAELSGAIA